MSPEPFNYSFTVPLHDIDAAGVMFYGHLFRHAHDAYEAFMDAIGSPLDRIIRQGNWLLPLVHAEADYRMPFRHGEPARIQLWVAEIGRSSFTLHYRFIDEDGRIRADAKTVHTHLAHDGRSGEPLPDALAAALPDWFCAPGPA